MLYEFSAGGVLLKDGYVLLIKNPSGVWTFPKGLVEEGEDPQQAALREVLEETGVKGRIVMPLGEVQYFYRRDNQKVKKRVLYYLMEYLEGDPRPSWEVLDAGFFELKQAEKMLRYRGDKEIFSKLKYTLWKN